MIDLTKYTTEEKVGQLFMVGFNGYEMDENIFNLIATYHIGGICYFSRNLKNSKQVRQLSEKLQSYTKTDFPLFLAVDQEGGLVNRITNDVVTSPPALALGAIDNRVYTRRIAEAVASDLQRIGINMNFGPVADINNNPLNPVIGTRSFGEDIKKVSKMVQDTIAGYERHDLIPSIKHFPGHGDTAVDSHLDVPIMTHSVEKLFEVELVPFIKAIENGVDSVMVSHLKYLTLDEEHMATLSEAIVTDLLRKQLQYKGVVITDCMEMDAIGNNYSIEEAAIQAIQAGVDIVLVSHTYDKQRRAIDAVIQAVKSGIIPESRIDESFIRILYLKKKRKIRELVPYETDERWRERQFEFSKRLTDLSITIVKDEKELLPIHPAEKVVLFWADIQQSSLADEKNIAIESLGAFLNKDNLDVTELALSEASNARVLCEEADKIIVVSNNILQHDEQRQQIQTITALFANKTIAIAIHSPYDYEAYPDVSTYIATYDPRPTTMESLSRLLIGDFTNRARLPITLNRKLKTGYRYKRKKVK